MDFLTYFLLAVLVMLGLVNVYLLTRKLTKLKTRLSRVEQNQRLTKKTLLDEIRALDQRSRTSIEEKLKRVQADLTRLPDAQATRVIKALEQSINWLVDHTDAANTGSAKGVLPVNNRPHVYEPDKSRRIGHGLVVGAPKVGSTTAHEDRIVDGSTVGKLDNSYVSTYEGFDGAIDPFHSLIRELGKAGSIRELHGVPGKLLTEDALKLYELGYFAKGDILELGCSHGLSTCILSAANHASGLQKSVFTVDLSQEAIEETRGNLERHRLGVNAYTLQAEGADGVQFFSDQGNRFEFAFIDHSHAYEHVKSVVELLPKVMVDGSFVLFHDFNDTRNFAKGKDDYGVVRGIEDGIKEMTSGALEYWGCYGCTGLFRFKLDGASAAAKVGDQTASNLSASSSH